MTRADAKHDFMAAYKEHYAPTTHVIAFPLFRCNYMIQLQGRFADLVVVKRRHPERVLLNYCTFRAGFWSKALWDIIRCETGLHKG